MFALAVTGSDSNSSVVKLQTLLAGAPLESVRASLPTVGGIFARVSNVLNLLSAERWLQQFQRVSLPARKQ